MLTAQDRIFSGVGQQRTARLLLSIYGKRTLLFGVLALSWFD
jgi:hypothetical protein